MPCHPAPPRSRLRAARSLDSTPALVARMTVPVPREWCPHRVVRQVWLATGGTSRLADRFVRRQCWRLRRASPRASRTVGTGSEATAFPALPQCGRVTAYALGALSTSTAAPYASRFMSRALQRPSGLTRYGSRGDHQSRSERCGQRLPRPFAVAMLAGVLIQVAIAARASYGRSCLRVGNVAVSFAALLIDTLWSPTSIAPPQPCRSPIVSVCKLGMTVC